jgi:hypothetical protein
MNTSGCFQKTIVGSQAGATESRASVLDCGSPLPLFHRSTGSVKRQRAAAVQNLAVFSSLVFQARPQPLLKRSTTNPPPFEPVRSF